jgi:hypothetical protein
MSSVSTLQGNSCCRQISICRDLLTYRRRCGFVLPVRLVLFFILAHSAELLKQCHAALDIEQSFVQHSEDQQYVFVMLAPKGLEAELADPSVDLLKTREVRSKYQVSGLYSNQQPPKLIWRYGGRGFSPNPVEISIDGQYAVLYGDFLVRTTALPFEDIAEFLVKGKSVARPTYNDISSNFYMDLRRMVLGVDFVRGKSAGLNEDNDTFVVQTNLHEEIVFELATGKVVRYHDPFRFPMVVAILTASLVIIAIVGRLIWKDRKREAEKGAGSAQGKAEKGSGAEKAGGTI